MENIKATIHVIDDDPHVCEALGYLLGSVQLDVRTFGSIAEFLDEYRPDGAGCLVLDVRMPGMSGMEFLERLDALGVDLPVIMLSGHGTIPMATRAMRAGAVDFIQKPVNEQLLLDRVQEAIGISRRRHAQRAVSDCLAALTSREMEIVSLIARGLHNKDIAQQLGLSSRTVEAHRARAMHKLGVHNTADLVGLVVEHFSSCGGGHAQ